MSKGTIGIFSSSRRSSLTFCDVASIAFYGMTYLITGRLLPAALAWRVAFSTHSLTCLMVTVPLVDGGQKRRRGYRVAAVLTRVVAAMTPSPRDS